MKAEPIPVAVYARASSDEQTDSVKDQLKALRAEAKKRGYRIVREYVDDGLSGSREIEKRIAFHALIADSYKREYDRIFVWDSSRFGRLDLQAAAEYKLKLRKNGVSILDSLAEGPIDWGTQMGRLTDALMSEANYETALKISRSSIRGRMEQLVERRVLPHSQVPFGYDRCYEGAGQRILIKRQAQFRMPKKGWTRTLVVNGEEATTIRRVYDLFTRRSMSLRQIARLLDSEGVPAWTEKGWSWDSVKTILSSKAYLGYGVVRPMSGRGKIKEAHNRMEATEVPGVIPVILSDDQQWLDAQRLLAGTTRKRWRSDKTNRPLAGIWVCGHCGHNLVARQRKSRHTGVQGPVFYSCVSKIKRFNTPCVQWMAYESEVMPHVIRELVKVVDSEIITQLTTKQPAKADPTAGVEKEVARLREQTKRATLRAAVADDDMLAEYEEVARELRGELKKAEERLRLIRHVESEGGPGLWCSWWADVRPGLVLAGDSPELAEELSEAARRHPALARLRGRGGWSEFEREARKQLVRLHPDGDTDPLRTILPQLLDGESVGEVVDGPTLRGILRKLGCSVSLWWRENQLKAHSNHRAWVLDKGRLSVSFRWSGVTHRPDTNPFGA